MLSRKTTWKIISYLNNKKPEKSLQKALQGIAVEFVHREVSAVDLSDAGFWQQCSSESYDAVLIPMGKELLQGLLDQAASTRSLPVKPPLWHQLDAPVIAVLTDDSLQSSVYAAQLDFDGIIASPFSGPLLADILEHARQRKQRRMIVYRRYCRMRNLFREFNHRRRRLRDKVDLLCHDLVQSNAQLAQCLMNVRRVYEFQSNLTGEFDLHFMLYSALGQITRQIPSTGALVYMTESKDIEAHLTGSWQEEYSNTGQLEDGFYEGPINWALYYNDWMLSCDAGRDERLSDGCREILAGLSFLAVPLQRDDESQGVLVLYRSSELPLQSHDMVLLKHYLPPLTRAIAAISKIQPYLVK